MAAPARFRAFVLNEARQNLAINNYGTAFSHYLLAIKIDHDLPSEILDEFVVCMCRWTDLLCCLERQEDVRLAFSQARAVCCFSDTLMCALGEQALRYTYVLHNPASSFTPSLLCVCVCILCVNGGGGGRSVHTGAPLPPKKRNRGADSS